MKFRCQFCAAEVDADEAGDTLGPEGWSMAELRTTPPSRVVACPLHRLEFNRRIEVLTGHNIGQGAS